MTMLRHLTISLVASVAMVAMVGVGCSSVKRPETEAPCIKENQKQLMIRWGTTEETGSRLYYELDARAELWTVSVVGTDTTRKHTAVIDPAVYCSKAAEVNTTFLKVQALYSPGTRSRFIEYTNAPTNVYLRAVWNPDLSTFQSRDMRAQYDDLMKLVPKD